MSFLPPDSTPKRYRGRSWSIDIMPKPWYIDLLIIGVVVTWMSATFWMIRAYGPSLELLVPAVVIGLVGILLVYGQRLVYLQLGDTVVARFNTPYTNNDEPDNSNQEYADGLPDEDD